MGNKNKNKNRKGYKESREEACGRESVRELEREIEIKRGSGKDKVYTNNTLPQSESRFYFFVNL